MVAYAERLHSAPHWPANVWAGVPVENQYWAKKRIPQLCLVPAAVRFLSCEPLLKPLWLDLHWINWVIVGGESGPRSRPMQASWVEAIRDQCIDAGVPFFFKQWGGRSSKSGGRRLDGATWGQFPFAENSLPHINKRPGNLVTAGSKLNGS